VEISNADITSAFSVVLTGLVGFVAKFFSSKITDIDKKQSEIELRLASEFVKKADLSDLEKSVNEIKQAISVGTVEFREIKNSQVKIENRLENLCACFVTKNGGSNV